MATFNGQLKTNKLFSSLYNMIISQTIFGTGLSDLNGIYASRKVDGTLYGDSKIYVSTDALKSYAWDGSDTPGGYNLLTQMRPPLPATDIISIDKFSHYNIRKTVQELYYKFFIPKNLCADINKNLALALSVYIIVVIKFLIDI